MQRHAKRIDRPLTAFGSVADRPLWTFVLPKADNPLVAFGQSSGPHSPAKQSTLINLALGHWKAIKLALHCPVGRNVRVEKHISFEFGWLVPIKDRGDDIRSKIIEANEPCELSRAASLHFRQSIQIEFAVFFNQSLRLSGATNKAD